MALYKQKRSSAYWYDFTYEGKRYRGSTGTSNLSRARTFESETLLAIRQKGPDFFKPGKSPTLGEMAARFTDWVENSRLDHDTKRYYEYGWRLLKGSRLNGMRTDAITNDDVDLLRLSRTIVQVVDGEKREVCKPYSAQYHNQAIRTLNRMLAKAVEWNLIRIVPKLKLARANGRELMIDQEAEGKLLAAASQPLRDVITIMMDAGMRPSEVFQMRWEDVHWTERAIFIPKSKTEKGRRRVPISARMMDLLLVRCNGSSEGWVFPSDSRQGHLTTVAKAFTSARKRAGVDSRIVLYSARHSFGTFVMKSTGNLPGVMSAMGHADVRSTLPYQHQGIEDIRDVIDRRNDAAQLRHTLRHTSAQVN